MKSFTQVDAVLPKQLELSPEQQQALTDLADRIVAETLQANEDFIANDRRVDGRVWKKVKSRENVHVYRTRRSGSKTRGSSDVNEKDPSRPRLLSNNAVEQHQRDAIAAGRPLGFVGDDDDEIHHEASQTNTHSSTSDGGSFAIEESVLAKSKPSFVPLIEASGVMDGSVEDAAFGALADTKYAWEVRSSYTKNDGFDGRKVLATLQRPSEEDPFRFVGVKWATRDFGAFMTRRDVVFLESSGFALDSDGERVFYSLAHSVELAEVPSLSDRLNIIRMNLSSCYIMRQLNEDKIDVYCRGYSDMGGEMPEGFSVSFFSAAVAGVSGMVECSYLKKLSWFMSRRRQSDSAGARSSHCGVCGKSVNKLSNLVQSSSGCPICRLPVCSKCSVQKKLSIVSPEDVVQKQFCFCLSCVIEARRLSAWDVATSLLTAS
ncbi:hypothetical protein PF005_g30412 [Phytophthora fragariae]|uniref:FYVE-type domain-containing protein n=1 Tax=Phytophthora fragariae TaxID=53985 RepID=A0A6A3DFB7_9STRA|nr:hypothetical protein PF003_g36125 [Phytophthora fragariae]KAE8919023.1 hypothetical protein PF009_g30664 [Phytophthora fragariae]KAE8962566.1 hypothetical protein PF011_g29336 [Phytophthora fragariae]KAE9061482.1 hypothetical protein PF010_g29801 [Phytophthora fragariae]KAE9061921.1 hypothetical protein PF007_g30090 [Phytophthora fragariae]